MNSSLTRVLAFLLALLAVTAFLAGCGKAPPQLVFACNSGGSVGANQRAFDVVAAENFWGSIATQLAVTRPTVRSIIVNPNTDPHSYEPTAQDARTIAGAKMAIVNGIGYDNWMTQELGASPRAARRARRRRPSWG